MSVKLPELDDSTTFAGILIGMVVGALYALLHIKQTGAVRRKDLTQFGAGSRGSGDASEPRRSQAAGALARLETQILRAIPRLRNAVPRAGNRSPAITLRLLPTDFRCDRSCRCVDKGAEAGAIEGV